MSKRGVIIAGLCDASIESGRPTIRAPFLDPILIRTSLLYWDRIDIPDNDLIAVGLPTELDILTQERILSRKLVPILHGSNFNHLLRIGGNGSLSAKGFVINGQEVDMVDLLNQVPVKAFNELMREQDTLWSYVQNSPTVASPSSSGRSLLFEIHNALPVPDSDVPIEKILDFKLKRQSDLLALRQEIDESYQMINNATDIDHAKSMAFTRLSAILSDLEKIAKETLASKLKRSLRYEINPVRMFTAAAIPSALGSLPLGAFCAFGSCFSLNVSEMFSSSNLPYRLTPYKYILDAQNDLSAAIRPAA